MCLHSGESIRPSGCSALVRVSISIVCGCACLYSGAFLFWTPLGRESIPNKKGTCQNIHNPNVWGVLILGCYDCRGSTEQGSLRKMWLGGRGANRVFRV